MTKHFIERGKYKGRYDVPNTLLTMEVGEKWIVEDGLVNIRSLRNACSLANKNTDMKFEVHCPGFSVPYTSVIRTK